MKVPNRRLPSATMKLLYATALAVCACSATAGWEERYRGTAPKNPVVIASINDEKGYRVDLYDSQHNCPAGERSAARFPFGNPSDAFFFCWRVDGHLIILTSMTGGTFTYGKHKVIPTSRFVPML